MHFSFQQGILAGALTALVCLAASCAPAASPDTANVGSQALTPSATTGSVASNRTVTIADNTFETNWINNAVYKYIVEKGYGYPVEEVVLTTPGMQVALAKGDIDLAVEFWPGNMQDWWDKETAAGNVADLGDVYGGGDQFFMIPKWVADQYKIKTVEDMKRPDVVKLFPDPEDPSKGAFINCIIGWQCAEVNRAKFKAYGLDDYYTIVSPGSSGAMDAAIVGPMKKKQPVFAYYWSPTSIAGAYDWYILEEPAYSRQCWDEVMKGRDDTSYTPKMACAYETQRTLKAAAKKFLSAPAPLLQFTKDFNVGTEQLNKTAAWAIENDIQGKWNKAAAYYLTTFEGRWKAWVPEDVYQKVKAALAQE